MVNQYWLIPSSILKLLLILDKFTKLNRNKKDPSKELRLRSSNPKLVVRKKANPVINVTID